MTEKIFKGLLVSGVAGLVGFSFLTPVVTMATRDDVGAEIGVGVGAGVSGKNNEVDDNGKAEAKTSLEIEVGESTTTDEGNEADQDQQDQDDVISIKGNAISQLRANENSAVASQATIDPATITTKGQLNAYAKALAAADENVEGVEIDKEKVELNYRQKAKFLGFIPVSIRTDVTVNADGSVNVSYPWYSFLMAKNRAEVESSVEARVTTIILAGGGVSGGAEAAAEFSAETQARVLKTVREILRANLELEAETNIDAEAEATAGGTVEE